jgi:ornithine cyclodeaminase/alanine dehydrogenase
VTPIDHELGLMKPLRHLSASEVAAAMPPLGERLGLAELTMRALGRDAEMPPKIGVHPRQPGSLAHAMPALLRGEATDGAEDLIGAKWIVGFPANPARGLPTYHALVLLNDPLTGEPVAVMDAATITAARTAAISGAAIRHFLPGGAAGVDAPRVALLGAGAQARGHLPVIGQVLPGARVRITDVDADRASALAGEAAAVPGIRSAEPVAGVREAVESADVVVSVVSFGPDRQALDPEWLGHRTLFVAVDYDMQAPAALARESLFVVDERDQFLATRSGPSFAGYPDPDATIGELLRGEEPRSRGAGSSPEGRILVTHLGVGLADVVFASAILARAQRLGLGRLLPS